MNAPPNDPWQRAVERLRAEHGESPTGKGKVLKVKFGYNPNSSSVGSVITILLWTAAFGATALNVTAALLKSRRSPALPPGEGPKGETTHDRPPTSGTPDDAS